jgi:SAM-dependent methyltransferase
MIQRIRQTLHPAFRRAPGLRSFALDVIDVAARSLLWPFRVSRPPSDARAAARLDRQTDVFNEAAERYYSAHADSAQLLDKPFSEPAALARRLIDVGVLIDAMRLEPGDTVLELGAGTCWLSQLLNRFGCRTISVDVSPTALALGRQMFDRDPRTNWSLDPQFLPYDGRALPVADASIDRLVLYDAYHHLPNPGRLMKEMRRVLTPEGIVVMSEPGRGHAASAPSVAEAAATGVLENELVLEDIAELALRSGFSSARVVVAGRPPLVEIDAAQLRPFMGGRGFARYWKQLCASLDGHHYLLLFAGEPEPTTRRPKLLRAELRVASARAPTVPRGAARTMLLDVHNAGDTRWIAADGVPGWTRVGAHLYRRVDGRASTAAATARVGPIETKGPGPAPLELVDFDWLRVALPGDLAPGQQIRIAATLPAIDRTGTYQAVFDPVIEGRLWFAERGSMPCEVLWTVVDR